MLFAVEHFLHLEFIPGVPLGKMTPSFIPLRAVWGVVTGLALLVWRDTGAMALLLAIHLGAVMALFLTLPYGKFAHGIFRSAALLKWAIEKRLPGTLKLGDPT